MKSKKERKRINKSGQHCSADGQKCDGQCRKTNSKEGTCDCKFIFRPEDERNLET
jgi:hypothetical protein